MIWLANLRYAEASVVKKSYGGQSSWRFSTHKILAIETESDFHIYPDMSEYCMQLPPHGSRNKNRRARH
jgi:hypothetical protein